MLLGIKKKTIIKSKIFRCKRIRKEAPIAINISVMKYVVIMWQQFSLSVDSIFPLARDIDDLNEELNRERGQTRQVNEISHRIYVVAQCQTV